MDNFYNPLQACNKPLEDYLLSDSTDWRYSPIFELVRVPLHRVDLFTFGQPNASPSILLYNTSHPVVAHLGRLDMARQVDDFAIFS